MQCLFFNEIKDINDMIIILVIVLHHYKENFSFIELIIFFCVMLNNESFYVYYALHDVQL
jgi:hypothetical protein